jgi:DNA-binding NtrC family response regulator
LNQLDIIPAAETQDFESHGASKVLAKKELVSLKKTMESFEKNLLVEALQTNRWHREKAAASLELAPRTFYRKIKKYGL